VSERGEVGLRYREEQVWDAGWDQLQILDGKVLKELCSPIDSDTCLHNVRLDGNRINARDDGLGGLK